MQYYHPHWMFSQSIIYMRTSKLNVPSWCNLVGGGFFLWHFFDIHFVPLGGKSWNPTAEVPCRGSSLLAMQAQKPNQPKHRKRPHQILQTCVHDKRHAISHFWIKNKSFVLIISLKYMIKRAKFCCCFVNQNAKFVNKYICSSKARHFTIIAQKTDLTDIGRRKARIKHVYKLNGIVFSPSYHPSMGISS